MKKITFLLPLMAIPFFCQGQIPAGSESLLDKKIKFTSLSSATTKKAFKYPAIIANTHKVLAVSPYENFGTTKFILKLQSPEKGIFYYDYDPKYNRRFILDVVGNL